jgi:hypothetical protein
MAQMVAQRETIRTGIRRNEINLSVSDYTIYAAQSDLQNFEYAGTIPGALQSIAADAGQKANTASIDQKNLTISRSPAAAQLLATPPQQAKIANLQIKINALTDQQALALAKNPPVADSVLDQGLLAKDPSQTWLTNAKAARGALLYRVTLMRDPANDVPKWEAALP